MNGMLIGEGLLLVIIALYFVTYILNKNTEVPEGSHVIPECSTCGNGSCSLARRENYSNSEDIHCEQYTEV